MRHPQLAAKPLGLAWVLSAVLLAGGWPGAHAQSSIRNEPPFPLIGKIKPRSASQITASSWSVGGETLDRDYADFNKYKHFLGPLGAKSLRVQAGWNKCEKVRGQYQWAWLDEVVNGALAQGVQPWLETSYGNTNYPGGGGTGLGGGFPTSGEALQAWDRWVGALVKRYQDRVHEWEVWNEPDLGKEAPAEAYVDLFIRTAEIIRREQPQARIYALGLAGNSAYAEKFLQGMQQKGKLDLITAITVHGYPKNPDDTSLADKVGAMARKFSPSIQIRQGETGAPSTSGTFGALKGLPWTELTQAKYDLRRMLAHLAKDVPFNLFTLMELNYAVKGTNQMNTKGLLKANPDQTVAYAKPAYYAAQHVFAIFDDSLQVIPNFEYTCSVTQRVAVHAFQKGPGGQQVVAVWLGGGTPTDANTLTSVGLSLPQGRFQEPVYADLRTGQVRAIPQSFWTSGAQGCKFTQLPLYDSPILVAEKSALLLQ